MKNVVRYSLLTFVLFLYMAAAFAQKGALHGTVSGLDAPLQGATVTAGTSHVLTDKKGWFSFSLDAGTYTLIITHAGYKKAVQEVMVTGDTQTIHVRLSPVESLGEVVILGSRSVVQRSNLLTPVAVDVFSAQQLVQTAQPTLTQMLQFSVPSFNASRPLVNEPVTLRGLAPDQLLILVNGTRRHSMAYIPPSGLRGILGQGSVANDLNAIPFSAVERLEILRDGASAQYGSDAIAGVINIVLKKSTGKTSVQWQTGQFYKGDGENFIVGINRGIALNKKGHLNFSADFATAILPTVAANTGARCTQIIKLWMTPLYVQGLSTGTR
jgi:iron complex outermembrane receptor protein